MAVSDVLHPDEYALTMKDINDILYGDMEVPTVPAVPPHQCPHCKRDRHAEPLTRQVAQMYDNHEFRSDYSPETDDSPIVCVGADYCGPNRPAARTFNTNYGWVDLGCLEAGTVVQWKDPAPDYSYSYSYSVGAKSPNWLKQMLSTTAEWMKELSLEWQPWQQYTFSEWFATVPPKPLEPCDAPDISVTFGAQWKPWERAASTIHEREQAITGVPHIFAHRHDFPVPERPGYDFSQYAEDVKPYYLKDKK